MPYMLPRSLRSRNGVLHGSPCMVNVHGGFAFKARMESFTLRGHPTVVLRRLTREGPGSRANLQPQRLKAELLVYVADLQPVGLVEAGF